MKECDLLERLVMRFGSYTTIKHQ